MARNLLDDEDWARLAATVEKAVEAVVASLDKGTLARLDKRTQDIQTLDEQILARVGEEAAETVALRTQVQEALAKLGELRRTVGSGNLHPDQQAQVDVLFAETETALTAPPSPAEPEEAPKKGKK